MGMEAQSRAHQRMSDYSSQSPSVAPKPCASWNAALERGIVMAKAGHCES